MRDSKRPWMRTLAGETREDRNHRINHTCYKCGRFDPDLARLAEHEDECRGTG